MSVADALAGIVLPAVVAGVLLLLGRMLRGAGGSAGGSWASALALGVGYLAGHIGVRGWRGGMPKESTDWIAVAAATGLLAGVAGVTRRGPSALRVLLRWGLAFAAAWFVAGRSLARRGDLATVLGEMALVATGAALAWWLLESRRDDDGERPTVLAPLLLLTAVGCAALALGLSGSVLFARLGGALAATLGAALCLTSLRLAPALLPGGAAVIALLLLSLLLAATVHARLPLGSALLLALAALVPAPAARAAQGSPAPQPGRGFGALLLCALLGGAAIGLAYAASPPLDF